MNPILAWVLWGAAVGLVAGVLEKRWGYDIQGDSMADGAGARGHHACESGSGDRRTRRSGSVGREVVDHPSANQPGSHRGSEPLRLVQDGAPEVVEPEGGVQYGETPSTETPAPSGQRPVQEAEGGAPPNPSPENPETVEE